MQALHPVQIDPIIIRAIQEDWGHGDWTTDLAVPENKMAVAKIIAKEDCIIAGVEVASRVFHKVDADIQIDLQCENGAAVKDRQTILEIRGSARSILKAERVALNLLSRMSGIATKTRAFVDAVEGTFTQILDTRKTTPGLRILEKSATVVGGARNHRFGLSDGVIVKENHIRAAGSIQNALGKLLESLPPTMKIEVEVTNLDEVKQALEAGAEMLMLDNMSLDAMQEAVSFIKGRALVEASGNVKLSNVKEIAQTGVDFVSTSAILHSSRWVDLSLLFNIDD